MYLQLLTVYHNQIISTGYTLSNKGTRLKHMIEFRHKNIRGGGVQILKEVGVRTSGGGGTVQMTGAPPVSNG